MNKHILITIIVLTAVLIGGYRYGCYQRDLGYDTGYDIGYRDGYQERNRLALLENGKGTDTVQNHTKTETKIVYEKIPYTGTDVQVRTEKPMVTVEVNGKKQEVVQHSETADLAVKTETAVKVKVPERRWAFGVGTDGKKPMYMLKAPVSGAVGAWVAGGSHKFMGGVSISF